MIEKLYRVLLDGATPSINTITYEFWNEASNTWESSLTGLSFSSNAGSVFFIIIGSTVLETKLRITIDDTFELIRPIEILSK